VDTDNDSSDGTWMTYAELAAARGIDRQSAARLTFRRHWRRQKDNHGTVRAFVPIGWQDKSHDASPDTSQDDTHDASRDISRVINALESAVDTLSDQLANTEKRANRAEIRVDEATNRAILAEQAIAGERIRAEASESKADTLRDRFDTAQAALDDLRVQLGEAQAAVRIMAERTSQQVGRAAEAEADLRRELEAVQMALSEAQADAAELGQADEARKGRGRWRRLRDAWRGE
jgi:chromosome segregation ATPase